jgi:hypothetical protein
MTNNNYKKLFYLLPIVTLLLLAYQKSSIQEFLNFQLRSTVANYSNTDNLNSPHQIFSGEEKNYGFKFKIDFVPKTSPGYPNLFQTADVNEGFRIETAGSSISYVIKSKAMANGLYGGVLSSNMTADTLHNLSFNYNPISDNLKIEFDGKIIRNEAAPKIFSKNFIIGKGFTNERIFTGTIKNVDGEIFLLEDHNFAYYIFGLFLLILSFVPLIRSKVN